MTSALAVAVDEVSTENTGAQNTEAHEKCNAAMHAYVHAFMYSDTLLSIGHENRCTEEQYS